MSGYGFIVSNRKYLFHIRGHRLRVVAGILSEYSAKIKAAKQMLDALIPTKRRDREAV